MHFRHEQGDASKPIFHGKIAKSKQEETRFKMNIVQTVLKGLKNGNEKANS